MNESSATRPPAATTSARHIPGWHNDPDHPGVERFWNGAHWTARYRSATPADEPTTKHARGSDAHHAVDHRAEHVAGHSADHVAGHSAELPASLLGPIDPALQALLDSFDGDHSSAARVESARYYEIDHKLAG